MKQCIGIYGGSFNPIHLGHIEKIKRLDELCHFNDLYFLPCGEHALKNKTLASSNHRLAMLKIALADYHFKIDDQELRRKGKSFTIDTLRHYRQLYHEDTSLSFIMGHDAFSDFMQWKDYESILNLAHIILLSRPSQPSPVNEGLSVFLNQHLAHDLTLIHQKSAGFIFNIQEQDYPYSSTEIRDQLQHQKKPLGLDPMVFSYINKHQLYRL